MHKHIHTDRHAATQIEMQKHGRTEKDAQKTRINKYMHTHKIICVRPYLFVFMLYDFLGEREMAVSFHFQYTCSLSELSALNNLCHFL